MKNLLKKWLNITSMELLVYFIIALATLVIVNLGYFDEYMKSINVDGEEMRNFTEALFKGQPSELLALYSTSNTTAVISTFVFWGIIGAFVYGVVSIVWSMFGELSRIIEAKDYVYPNSKSRRSMYVEQASKFFVRMISLILMVALIFIGIMNIMPTLLSTYKLESVSFGALNPWIFVAMLVQVLFMHILVVLLRFIKFRPIEELS